MKTLSASLLRSLCLTALLGAAGWLGQDHALAQPRQASSDATTSRLGDVSPAELTALVQDAAARIASPDRSVRRGGQADLDRATRHAAARLVDDQGSTIEASIVLHALSDLPAHQRTRALHWIDVLSSHAEQPFEADGLLDTLYEQITRAYHRFGDEGRAARQTVKLLHGPMARGFYTGLYNREYDGVDHAAALRAVRDAPRGTRGLSVRSDALRTILSRLDVADVRATEVARELSNHWRTRDGAKITLGRDGTLYAVKRGTPRVIDGRQWLVRRAPRGKASARR